MSVFSVLKRGREQAKERKAVEKAKEESGKLPYRHIPTHAAADALATAPASWKYDDRPKIREQNRRRTAMAASGMGNSGRLPSVGSSLAYVSYPSAHANPVVPLPRHYSYSSIPSSWRERMATMPEGVQGMPGMQTAEPMDYLSQPRDYKGKGKGKEIAAPFIAGTDGTASPAYYSDRASTLSSRETSTSTLTYAAAVDADGDGDVAVGNAIGVAVARHPENPSNSEDEGKLGNQASRDMSYRPEPNGSSSRSSSSNREGLHRLHPAHSRRVSDTQSNPHKHTNTTDRHYPPPAKSTYFSAPRPMVRRAPNGETAAPARQFYSNPAPSSSASSVMSIGMAISTAPTSAESTPPPSTAGDAPRTEAQRIPGPSGEAAPITRRRRFSLTERVRRSFDSTNSFTISPPSQVERQEPPSRGRRLTKSRPNQSVETERPSTDRNSRVSVEPAHFSRPSQAATESTISGLDQMETTRPRNIMGTELTSKQDNSRRKLSRGQREGSTDGKGGRWSLFGRRNSVTSTHDN
ncbi:hypothetical protein GGS20DRAFT_580790 [Poronia punctata]|nr:hypothetical protein GGS20DRAFT_580790 [Poronia punctata]